MTRPTQVPLGRQHNCRVRDCHPLWSAFPSRSASWLLCNSHVRGPTTPQGKPPRFGLFRCSLAATEEIDFSFFSTGYLDVSVHRVGPTHLCIQRRNIRESRDQRSFVSSPRLIADFHALHRLLTPRHPPCALSSLTTRILSSPPNIRVKKNASAKTQNLTLVATNLHSHKDAIRTTTKLSKIESTNRTIPLYLSSAAMGRSTQLSSCTLPATIESRIISKVWKVARALCCSKRQRIKKNGDEGDRTPNPRLAKPVLSQLSYVPGFQRRRRQNF